MCGGKNTKTAVFIIRMSLFTMVVSVLMTILKSPVWGQPANLGRLVFTDYKPDTAFTVDLFNLADNTRMSLPNVAYKDIGRLATIDSTHVYVSVCFERNNPMFCSALVDDILSPEQVKGFDIVEQVWKKDYGSPIWSPDGTQIAFTVIHGGTTPRPTFYYSTYVMNADGTQLRTLTPGEDDNGPSFTWSPDSQQIAFACHSERSLCIADAHGGKLKQVDMMPNTKVRDLAWSPNGTQIAFALLDGSRHSELYVVNVNDLHPYRLLKAGTDEHNDPFWSPDGSKIAFRAGEQGNNIGEIYVINPDGTNLHNLSRSLNGNEFGAVWSPDSTRIAFFSAQDQAGTFLYISNADSIGLQRITDNRLWGILDVRPPEVFWLP